MEEVAGNLPDEWDRAKRVAGAVVASGELMAQLTAS